MNKSIKEPGVDRIRNLQEKINEQNGIDIFHNFYGDFEFVEYQFVD